MEDNEPQLHLKKRARRRLVGAVAFAGFAAVVLPMIMDQEPPPAPQDVEIRIPGQDDKPFAPKFASAPTVVPPSPVESAPPAETLAKPAVKPVEAPLEKPVVKPAKPETPLEKPISKPTEKPSEKPLEKVLKPQETTDAQRAAAILAGKAPDTPAATGQYVILIGAFADQSNVKNLQSKLTGLGIKVFTEPLDSPQGRKIRVRAGPFASRDVAEKALEKMKRIGVSGVLAAKQ